MTLTTPCTPPGTMELLPRQQIVFQRMMDTIRRGFELYGFLPIETPVFEVSDVLLSKSGGETEKQVYFVQSTGGLEQGHRPGLALRFDLTVPLARYVAEHEAELAFPFRRYQIQRVYRGERAQRGRYREFYQCDIDVIGKDTLPLAFDAEIPAVIHTLFSELKVGPFRIHFNNRKVLQGLFEGLGIHEPERRMAVLRQVDRLDKVGPDGVRGLLMGGELGLAGAVADRILELVGIRGPAADVLARLGAMAGRPGANPVVRPGRAGTGRSGVGPEGVRGARVPLEHQPGHRPGAGLLHRDRLRDLPHRPSGDGLGVLGRALRQPGQPVHPEPPAGGGHLHRPHPPVLRALGGGAGGPGAQHRAGAGDPVRPGPAARVPGPGGGPEEPRGEHGDPPGAGQDRAASSSTRTGPASPSPWSWGPTRWPEAW